MQGVRFGRLIATNQTRKEGRVLKRLCICDCGNKTWQTTNHLTSGHTRSCGCLLRDFRRLEEGEAARNEVLDNYKRGAEKRNLLWDLSDEEFDDLVNGRCFYCGSLPETIRRSRRNTGNFIYNGIDRLDSAEGYTPDNVVTACSVCNRAKSDMSLDNFLSWIYRLKGHNIEF